MHTFFTWINNKKLYLNTHCIAVMKKKKPLSNRKQDFWVCWNTQYCLSGQMRGDYLLTENSSKLGFSQAQWGRCFNALCDQLGTATEHNLLKGKESTKAKLTPVSLYVYILQRRVFQNKTAYRQSESSAYNDRSFWRKGISLLKINSLRCLEIGPPVTATKKAIYNCMWASIQIQGMSNILFYKSKWHSMIH